MRRTAPVEPIEPAPLSSAVNGTARNLVSHKHLKKFSIARKPRRRGAFVMQVKLFTFSSEKWCIIEPSRHVRSFDEKICPKELCVWIRSPGHLPPIK